MGTIANPAEWHNLREAWGEGVDAASGKGSGTGIYKWMKFLKPIWGATASAEFNRQKGLIGTAYEGAREGNPLKVAHNLAGTGPTGTSLNQQPSMQTKNKKPAASSLIGG